MTEFTVMISDGEEVVLTLMRQGYTPTGYIQLVINKEPLSAYSKLDIDQIYSLIEALEEMARELDYD